MPPRAPNPPSSEAVFRYVVVSRVLTRVAEGQNQADAIRAVAGEAHLTLDGARRLAGKRTIYRWLAAFREHGIEGLEPKPRPRCEGSAVLSDRFLAFLREQKEADPRASFPEIIRRAKLLGVLEPGEAVDRGTVWRAAQRMGLETRRLRSHKYAKDADVRRFAYAHRMQMLLCDGKHFRAGQDRAKRVALFFLDDASRYGLDVLVGTSENAALFLHGLYRVVRRHGLFDATFLDNGPGFIALDTIAAVAKLGATWITGTAGYAPAGARWRSSTRPPWPACCGTWTATPRWTPTAGRWSCGFGTGCARSTTTRPTRAWAATPPRPSAGRPTSGPCASPRTTPSCVAASWSGSGAPWARTTSCPSMAWSTRSPAATAVIASSCIATCWTGPCP